jgi:hypothetical protein
MVLPLEFLSANCEDDPPLSTTTSSPLFNKASSEMGVQQNISSFNFLVQ